jgi:hypothetical protein
MAIQRYSMAEESVTPNASGAWVKYSDHIAEMNKQYNQSGREIREAARDAAAEREWHLKQGEEYGSY